jgi:hypothetical protein
MSLFFPIHRPRVGLSFAERGLALVDLRRGWRMPSLKRVSERALPAGVIRPSASEPNVTDRDALVKDLRALLQTTSERTVAVCLPGRSCHLAVFPFETLPVRERDREPIVRWRFQHEEQVTLGEARVLHRVFPVKGAVPFAPGESKSEGQVTAYVLAMAIKRSIVEQYEQVCDQVGLLPVSISCASLQLFDFYRPLMQQGAELFFVHQAADSMAFFAIRQGVPVFLRTKTCRRELVDVAREIRSTLQFYGDLYRRPGEPQRSGPVPIYMVGDSSWQLTGAEGPSAQAASAETIIAMEEAWWQVQAVRPDWTVMVRCRGQSFHTEDGLYALACAVGS